MTILLRNGADTNIQNDEGFTALHHAAENGHLGQVRLLLSNKADVDLVTKTKRSKAQRMNNNSPDRGVKWEYTALQMAAMNSHTDTVYELLARHAEHFNRFPDVPLAILGTRTKTLSRTIKRTKLDQE